MRRDARHFLWVGNHPGIDLVNTEVVDRDGDRVDLIADLAGLVDWATAAGLIDAELAEQCLASAQGRSPIIVLAWVRRLRGVLRDVLESADDARAAALDGAVSAVPVRLSYQPGTRVDLPQVS